MAGASRIRKDGGADRRFKNNSDNDNSIAEIIVFTIWHSPYFLSIGYIIFDSLNKVESENSNIYQLLSYAICLFYNIRSIIDVYFKNYDDFSSLFFSNYLPNLGALFLIYKIIFGADERNDSYIQFGVILCGLFFILNLLKSIHRKFKDYEFEIFDVWPLGLPFTVSFILFLNTVIFENDLENRALYLINIGMYLVFSLIFRTWNMVILILIQPVILIYISLTIFISLLVLDLIL